MEQVVIWVDQSDAAFGPYPSKEDAEQALRDTRWQPSAKGRVWSKDGRIARVLRIEDSGFFC